MRKWPLLILRLLSITFLSFLLVNPYIFTEVEKRVVPKVVLLSDVSFSIDSTAVQTTKRKFLDASKNNSNVNLIVTDFADGLNSKKRNATDIASTLDAVYNNEKQNLSHIILLSDGISNKGSNPAYNLENYTSPISSIALGDSTQKTDVLIELLNYPEEAESGAEIPFDAIIKAPKNQKELKVFFTLGKQKFEDILPVKNGVARFTKNVDFLSNKDFLQGELQVEQIANEVNTSNNNRKIYIKKKKSEYNIHLIYDAPNPDIGVWQRALSGKENTKVQSFKQSEYVASKSDKLIKIQFLYLPQSKIDYDANIHVLGNERLLKNAFGKLPVVFAPSGDLANVKPLVENFSNLFSFSGKEAINKVAYKTVEMPFGELFIESESQNLLSQNTDGLNSKYPLLASYKSKNASKAIYFGEGLWQFNTAFNMLSEDVASGENIEALLSELVFYLLRSNGLERLEIYEPSEILANESQSWSVNYINQNNEKVKGANLNLNIYNENAKVLASYNLVENKNYYQNFIAGLPSGVYTYAFTAELNGKSIEKSLKVLVKDEGVEQQLTQANHTLLRNLSEKTNGKFYLYNSLNENDIAQMLNINASNEVVYKNEKKYFTEYWLLWILLVLLLGSEWLIRRQSGMV